MKLYTEHSILDFLNFNNSEWVFNGCASYSQSEYSDAPMGEFKYKWEVTRNGITEIFYDTIFLNAGEYRTYEINY